MLWSASSQPLKTELLHCKTEVYGSDIPGAKVGDQVAFDNPSGERADTYRKSSDVTGSLREDKDVKTCRAGFVILEQHYQTESTDGNLERQSELSWNGNKANKKDRDKLECVS